MCQRTTSRRPRSLHLAPWTSTATHVALCVSVAVFPTLARTQSLPSATPEEVGFSSSALRGIAPALKRTFVDSGKIPGFVVAIARHGKIVLLDSAGFMDIEAAKPMPGSGVFRIMSMTKPITTVAVMQLVERGKVRLDDPVAKYIPAFANARVRAGAELAPATRPITIEHLLTHTSGLTYGANGLAILNRGPTIADFADSIVTLPLLFQPGSSFGYSLSLDVLGRVVEIASGRAFNTYLDEEIFGPLGMRETSFHMTPAMEGRIPRVYSRRGDGSLVAGAQLLGRGFQPESRLYAGGQGLLSTPANYLRFAQMLLNGGELEGKRVLQRSSVAQMMTNHVPTAFAAEVAKVLPGWPLGSYGFGYGGAVRIDSLASVPGSTALFRWGGINSTYFWIDPSKDLVAMVWTQFYPSAGTGTLDNEFQRLVYGAMVRP
jgi:CubicO group peptidase (beta-lactamase class C family)